jgi:hypothetical protein
MYMRVRARARVYQLCADTDALASPPPTSPPLLLAAAAIQTTC